MPLPLCRFCAACFYWQTWLGMCGFTTCVYLPFNICYFIPRCLSADTVRDPTAEQPGSLPCGLRSIVTDGRWSGFLARAPRACAGRRAPGRAVVALGWSSSDEGKMQRSFGVGRADFPAFVDLGDVFRDLGYAGQVCTLDAFRAALLVLQRGGCRTAGLP